MAESAFGHAPDDIVHPIVQIAGYVREDRIALAASGMMEVFKKMWPEAWGVRMEHILRNVLMALLEQQDATLHDVLRIFDPAGQTDFPDGPSDSIPACLNP